MRKVINIIAMISIGGLLLVGCGNSTTKDSNETTATEKEDIKEYTVSSTESRNGNKVKEEEGTVLINKDKIKTKVADSKGNKVDKDLDTKLRSMCEELSKIADSKDLEANPIDGTIYFALMGDNIDSMAIHKQEIIDYIKSKPVEGYKAYVMIGSRKSDKAESFEVK